MKWLIIGTGWISDEFALEAIRLGHKVTGIVSRDLRRARKFAEKYDSMIGYDSIKEAEDYDYVYVATPNATHYDIATQLIKLKKHVLVEKIMTTELELTEKLFALAAKNGVKLMEAYTHITQPEVNNYVGEVVKVNFQQLSSKLKDNTYTTASTFNEKSFGGVLPDLAVYPISMAVKILGNIKTYEISKVEFLNEVEADVTFTMEHERGRSIINVSKLHDGDNTLYIDGKAVSKTITFSHIKNRMAAEINVMTKGKPEKYKDISLEVVRIVELMKYQTRAVLKNKNRY